MKLTDLTAQLEIGAWVGGDPDARALAYDSRNVRPGSVFVAVPGTVVDGYDFIEQAVALGAVAVVAEKECPGLSVPQVIVGDSRRALAEMAGRFFDYPSRRLQLLGVTGTNGKTTTAYLLESIFRAAGRRTGLIGSIEYRIDGERFEAERTTPESLDLQQILAAMVSAGVEVAVMEVSSHALAMGRVDGCSFAARLFTNLSQDHLDYHADLEDYFQAKARLFTDPSFGFGPTVVNLDDEYGRRLLADVGGHSYGRDRQADYRISHVAYRDDRMNYKIEGNHGALEITSSLLGDFNVSNGAGAAALAFELGVGAADIAAGIGALQKVPGRFEAVNCDQDFHVLIDYAHTPDGLEKVLTAARDLASGHRLIAVFGCGGDRDTGKRPLMGQIGASLSDVAIVTSDNPRSEIPRAIIDDVLTGIAAADRSHTKVKVEREAAIDYAIAQAHTGDVVIIAGKGHENYQLVKDQVLPFDDRTVAEKALRKLCV